LGEACADNAGTLSVFWYKADLEEVAALSAFGYEEGLVAG
jgi:hypothetical protein